MRRIFFSIALMMSSAIFALADTAPSFPGGQSALIDYLVANMRYPETAAENGIEGRVLVNFTVEADGSLTNIKILRPIDPDLEAEAIRIVKGMPAWEPATDSQGKPVAAQATLPISFNISH